MKKILAVAVATAISAPAMADLTITGSVAAGYSYSDTYVTQNTAAAKATYAAAIAHVDANFQRDVSALLGVANSTATSLDASLAAAATARDASYALASKALTLLSAYETVGTGSDSGYGIDTASVTIAGSQALENGLTVSGSMTIGGINRAGGLAGEDMSMSVAGSFGTVSVKSVEAGNGVFGWASVGPAEEFSGELAAKSNLESVSYTAPKMGDFTLSAGFSQAADGIGAGDDTAFDPDLNVAYAKDAFSAFVNYKVCASESTCSDRVRVGAKYDAGVAVIAAAHGINDNNESKATAYKAVVDSVDTAVGVSVPMGAATVGLNWARTDADGSDAKDGLSFGVKYDLGAGVAVSAKHTQYDVTNTVDATKSSVIMSMSF